MKNEITYNVSPDDIQILDSWRVRKWSMRRVLREIRRATEGRTLVFRRSLFSLKMEWICHNAGFFAGIRPDETKDVDLNYPCKNEWLYIIGGIVLWIFVW